MTTKTRTRVGAGAVLLAASILFAGTLPAVGVPAVASASTQMSGWRGPVVDYVALGDSYAAGQGAGSSANACMQSDLSYPELLDDEKRIKLATDASCSGASTTDVLSTQLPAVRKRWKIDLVTLTVGANDVGGGNVLAACSVSFTSPQCQQAFGAALAVLTPPAPGVPSQFALRFGATLLGVAATIPGAAVLVTGYPYLFETPPSADPDFAAITQLNQAIALLNTSISGVAGRLAQTGADIRYVDVTPAFLGHGIGSQTPWILATGPDAFHPTAEGYVAYAAALKAAL